MWKAELEFKTLQFIWLAYFTGFVWTPTMLSTKASAEQPIGVICNASAASLCVCALSFQSQLVRNVDMSTHLRPTSAFHQTPRGLYWGPHRCPHLDVWY